MEIVNELALFAGAGGGILGGKLLGWRTVCAVELDPYCREILLRRQEEGHLQAFPVWDDVRTFDGKPWRGKVDVVTAGFPCQPFSAAGQRKGEDDDRNLWPETIRVLCGVRPRFAFLENVPAVRNNQKPGPTPDPSYFGRILGDLAEIGFDAEWRCMSAAELGAPHKRDRIWIVAHAVCCRSDSGSEPAGWKTGSDTDRFGARTNVANSEGDRGGSENTLQARRHSAGNGRSSVANPNRLREQQSERRIGKQRRRTGDGCASVANTTGQRQSDVQRGEANAELDGFGTSCGAGWWDVEPDVGRVADGVAFRVDRLKALGNGQVPRVAAEAVGKLAGVVCRMNESEA